MCNLYEQNIAFRTRRLAGKDILIGENKCYELNEVAFEIWKYLDNEHTIDEIIEFISGEFSEDVNIIKQDVITFTNSMLDSNAIRKVKDE